MLKWFYNSSAGIVFFIGFGLCFAFPIGTIIGVLLIFYSVSLLEKAEDVPEKKKHTSIKNDSPVLKKTYPKTVKEEFDLIKKFKSQVKNDPLSNNTEQIFLDFDIGYSDFYNAFKVDEDYSECLKIHLDKFEKDYEDDHGIFFHDYSLQDFTYRYVKDQVIYLLFNKIKNYKEICKFLNRDCIPELLEDWEKENKRQKQINQEKKAKIEKQKAIEKEKWSFIENILQDESIIKLEREEVQERVASEFFTKYGSWIRLKRIRGVWSVTKNGEVKKFKSK